MLDNMADLVQQMRTGTYLVKRSPGGEYVSGHYVHSGPDNEFQVEASIQPATGWTLDHWAEGDYARDVRDVYASFKFEVGDIVVVDESGYEYKVMSVEDYMDSGNYCYAVIRRKDVGYR